MSKKEKELPAKSDVEPKEDDNRYKHQDEYATPSQTEARNTRETEKLRDKQQRKKQDPL